MTNKQLAIGNWQLAMIGDRQIEAQPPLESPSTIHCVMPVAQELLDILVCPACKHPVKMTEKQDGLRCANCKCVYPIVDDIPVMLVDKALRE